MRQKLILTFIFSLVFLTIAITIVRGSVFHDEYSGNGKIQSPTFTWFWFYCEFSVGTFISLPAQMLKLQSSHETDISLAFLISCAVSFRSLFIQRANKHSALVQEQQRREAEYQSAIRRGWRHRVRNFHDSVLDTCKTLEGWSGSEAETLNMRGLPIGVTSGLVTVRDNSSRWSRPVAGDGTTTTNATTTNVSATRQLSMDSLWRPSSS